MNRTELREELISWVTAYKDAAERNALAENPDESAEYLLTLIDPEQIRKEVRDIALKAIADE